ncbi:DUF1838 family protein [Candidatus Foliamicus sp.]
MNDHGFPLLDRRNLLGAAGLGLLPGLAGALDLAGGAAELGDSPELKDPWMRDPQKAFHNFLRAQGDLSGRISPQWWRGGYLAIYGDRNPELLFRMEGCEMKRIVALGDNEFQFQYRIFTSFKDPHTNETLNGSVWRNPISGQEITVEPNISGAERIVALTSRGIVERDMRSGFEAVIHQLWTAQGAYAMSSGYKDRPAQRPIPMKEFATSFLDRRAAADFDAPRLEVRFNSTFVAPFQRWMRMPEGAGIAVWHASGHKARDVESLPQEYLEQMHKYRPEMKEWIGADGVA